MSIFITGFDDHFGFGKAELVPCFKRRWTRQKHTIRHTITTLITNGTISEIFSNPAEEQLHH